MGQPNSCVSIYFEVNKTLDPSCLLPASIPLCPPFELWQCYYVFGTFELTRRIEAQHPNSTQPKSHLLSSQLIMGSLRSCTTLRRMIARRDILLCPIRNSFLVFNFFRDTDTRGIQHHAIGSFLHVHFCMIWTMSYEKMTHSLKDRGCIQQIVQQ